MLCAPASIGWLAPRSIDSRFACVGQNHSGATASGPERPPPFLKSPLNGVQGLRLRAAS